MAYRALVIGIVLFWLAMTGLLFRDELFPNTAQRTAVPAAHVFKQMFLHEQASDLTLYRQRLRLGAFHVQPKRDGDSGAVHSVDIRGGSTLDFLGLPNQRVLLQSLLEFDENDAVRRFEISATVREPRKKESNLGIAFDGTPQTNQYHYVLKQGDIVQKEASGTPDQLLDDPALQGFGFDPRTVIRQMMSQAAGEMKIDAHRASMLLNGEMVETYLITIHQGTTTAATIQTTQQGQILAITTFAGYEMYDDTITP